MSPSHLFLSASSTITRYPARLGVSQSTVANWLSRTLKEEKERKREKAFALWLACHTQEEIAEAVEVAQNTVTGWEKEFIEKLGTDNLINSPDFTPPIYNVWKRRPDRLRSFGQRP